MPSARRLALFLVLVVAEAATAAPATLSRDVGDYFALSFRRMRLKDFYVEAPGCNLGVNCKETGRTCGRLQTNGAVVSTPGQIVGDDMCGPGAFWEVFRNNTSATCSPDCSMIGNDGPGPHCENTFTSPILGDLDNDGKPSCDGNCGVDIGDVAMACGVPYPLPACNLAKEVRVFPKSDCSPIEYDLAPGNGQCDLKLGTYGNIRVRNKAKIRFSEGTTVACMLAVGKATRVSNAGTALVIVPGQGKASFNNLSDVGGDCRSFKVVTEFGPVRFAKHGEFHLDACTLAGTMKLGHDNNLRGRFISGEFLVSNFNSTGACCEPTTTTTSTSTTTSSTSVSSTTSTSIPDLPAICCEDTSEVPPICGSAETIGDCLSAGGMPGPAGSVCEAGPEDSGRCTDAPPNPGGCCQFEAACAIGGGMDEVRCSSLGGAFVPDAICDPEGDCIPATTSTTVITVTTTVTSVTTTSTLATTTTIATTTSTSTIATTTSTTTTPTTSTSSTTNPQQPGVCCEDTSEEPPLCGSAETSGDCVAAGGTPGPAGSVCQAAPGGGGRCAEGPPNPGGCCQFAGSCAIGGDIDEVTCSSLGGAFIDDAVCSPNGSCGPPSTSTTSTTLTTVTTVPTTSSSVTTIPTTTFVTTSTSTTNTTLPGAVCCEHPGETPSTCGSAPSAAACTQSGGVVGEPGAVCQISPDGGVCATTPPPPGGCCETDGQCEIGGGSQEQCEAGGGTWVTDAQCLPDGRCVSVPDGGGFTRTLGFYKTHPGVTQWILDLVGGVTVCGIELTNTDYDDSHSALEALCISPKGDQRLQLVRQLTAAALTMAAGGATYADFDACNTYCATGTGSIYDVGDCINSADAFNNSGDNVPAPFDGVESGYPEFCQIAHNTACNVLTPDTCSQ